MCELGGLAHGTLGASPWSTSSIAMEHLKHHHGTLGASPCWFSFRSFVSPPPLFLCSRPPPKPPCRTFEARHINTSSVLPAKAQAPGARTYVVSHTLRTRLPPPSCSATGGSALLLWYLIRYSCGGLLMPCRNRLLPPQHMRSPAHQHARPAHAQTSLGRCVRGVQWTTSRKRWSCAKCSWGGRR